jgi:hypothetical protein
MIYIDMDDVTANLTEYANRVNGTKHGIGDRMGLDDWANLRLGHQRMFRDLEPSKEFINKVIWDFKLHHGGAAFLTALPLDEHSPWRHAPGDKLRWVHKHVGQEIDVFFGPYAHDKKNHCEPGDLLIDDNHQNCIEWVRQGGFAHLYRNVDDCVYWLKEMK